MRKMHLLGSLAMIAGFLGVIAFGVLGATRSVPAALVTHGVLFPGFVAISVRRSGGLTEWQNMKVDALCSVHHSIIVLIGGVFVAAGKYIATLVEPGSQPDSMTKAEQIYFGAVIACIGGGLVPIAIADWLSKNQTNRRHR